MVFSNPETLKIVLGINKDGDPPTKVHNIDKKTVDVKKAIPHSSHQVRTSGVKGHLVVSGVRGHLGVKGH